MRELLNQKSLPEILNVYESIIGDFVCELNSDPIKNKQKILEVCHVGKFLMLLGNQTRIDQLSEKPDFIINVDGDKVGLEHQIIIDQKSKEREGFFENIFAVVESELKIDPELPNFLANCYLNSDLDFRLSDKANFIQEAKTVVKQYILNGVLLPNSLIRRISSMPHSQKTISLNFGAWWQKAITPDVIVSAVLSKESKILTYKKNSGEKQWLLLVIGSLKNSSYEVEQDLIFELDTKFDKVYLLEDFRARLFDLK